MRSPPPVPKKGLARGLLRGFAARALLALAFLFAQQTASLHWLSHAIEATQAKAGKSAPVPDHCDECLTLGALGAGASARQVRLLMRFGEQVGVALQMLDDLTAVLPARHDKAGEDLRFGRPTWVWSIAAQHCDEKEYRMLTEQARACAGGADWRPICALLADIVGDAGLARAHETLARAGDLLAGASLPEAAVREVLSELAGLERAYG
jgi:hypothetical protein